MKLAVYGSLRMGMGNHGFLQGAIYEGTTRLEGYGIYQAFGSIPGIKPEVGKSTVVELYSDYNLEAIDRLEGEGSLYHRVVVNIDGEDCYTYVYGRPEQLKFELPDGDYAHFVNY